MNGDDREAPPASERTEETREQAAPRPGYLIVGMGASTGGLTAFEQFFTQMPPDTGAPGGGMAFVPVQHLAPDHASLLPELLAKYTRMPVQQAVTTHQRVVQEQVPVQTNGSVQPITLPSTRNWRP
jgi:chemotaxis response regulator CheB